jgi:hypothetical protein
MQCREIIILYYGNRMRHKWDGKVQCFVADVEDGVGAYTNNYASIY